MPETMTPVIPSVPAVACPSWCIQCEDSGLDENRRMIVFHNGASTKVPLSRGHIEDHFGDMTVCLEGKNGESPVIGLSRDERWADLTMEEAEQLAAILTSLVGQVRTAEFRY